MPLGRKVADIYAELNLDKDTLRQAMAAAGGEMGADADRLGKQLGDRMSQGMAGQVEQLSARLAKARLAEQKATDAVALAQARLTEAEGKGNVEGSRLLALQQKLSQAESTLAIAHDNTAKATTRHSAAEKQLAADLENLDKQTGPAADRVGRDAGDKLTQGIHLAIIRNSPLIAAGVGAALAFGAPVALAAASALFGGIAIAAAVQSTAVRSAWTGTWENISAVTKAQSGPMQAELQHLAGVTNARFMDMEQSITDAMTASVPLVDRFGTSVLNAADNALPGLTHAVQEAGPAVDGLGNLVESVGTGLGGFFDNISSHSPAAGQAFSSLGQILQTLLPLLGEMLGQGAELASVVLPPLARVVDVVAGALEGVAPLLPLIGAGFTSWKIISSVSGWLDGLTGKLDATVASGGRFSGMAGTASSALGRIGSALPAVTTGVVLLDTLWSQSQRQLDNWSQALVDGGQAAATATQQLSDAHSRSLLDAHSLGDAWGIVKGAFADGAAQLQGYDSAQAKASAGAQKLLAAMDPVSRAQALQKQALNDLNFALEKHGEGSASAETAERKYKDASDAVTAAEARQEQAIHGVTQAMEDQANEALAAIDSGIALRRAQTEATQAEKDYQAALATGKTHLNDNSTATLDYETALSRVVAASGQAAADASGLTDKLDLQKVSTAAQLQTLYQLRDELGSNFPASLQTAITKLEGMGVTTDTTKGKMTDLGNTKVQPTIGPATDNVTPQVDTLMNSLFDLGNAHPVPQADLDIAPANRNKDVMIGMLDNLGIQHPTPTADLNPAPFSEQWFAAMGQIGTLNAQHPTPTSYLNTGPLQTSTSFALGQLYTLGGTNPVSTSSLIDRASGPLSSIRAYLNSLDGRVVTTYVNTIGRSVLAGGGNIGQAVGRRYDIGGKIRGPGGPTDDLIQAVTDTGDKLRVSNEEWVVPGAPSKKYGDTKMAAIVAGKALVSLPGRDAGGRSAWTGSSGSSGSGGSPVTIHELHVHVAGNVDFTRPDFAMKIARPVRDAIVKLEASER